MGWLTLAVTLLKIVNQLMAWKLIDEGYHQAVADMTLSILARTKAGKAILDKVNAMSDADVDGGLRDLEPK